MSDIKRPAHRPKEFFPDMEAVEKLCRLNCTDDEIASFFGVCRKTVERERKSNPEFNDTIEKGKSYGKLSLRRKQVELAMDGNPTMLIWLGKQYMGQRDKNETAHTGADGGAIKVIASEMTDEEASKIYMENLKK